jgi:PAS domain S-box-containing protein
MDKDLQLEEQRKEIKTSELKYRSIFESFPDVYARIDLQGNIQVLSPSALFHTGFSLPELVGQSFKNLFFEAKEFEEIMRLCREKPVFSDYEAKIRQKKEGYKEMTIISRTFYQDGIPHLYEIILHDISQEKENSKKLKALNDELSKANSSLKRALDLKKEFLAHASHDLKNPISAIGGVVKLMEMEGNLPESQLENLAMIKSTTQYAIELLQQLVTDAMLDDENIKLTKTEFDLGLLVDEVVTLNKPNAERKMQKIKMKSSKGIQLFADRHKLREAIDNFVSNAVKYSPFEKEINVNLIDKGTKLRFEVKDNGPGLTEDDKRKVFGKFQRLSASPTADESSSGLGLSIVKRIIELHHGEVGLESEEGKGAMFFFEIPKEV